MLTSSQSGYKVVRIWAFGNTNDPSTEQNIYYRTLNSSGAYINYSPHNGLPHLDYAVARAEKVGIKLIMTLLNNFDALGGINTYTTAFGGSHNTFFTDARSQDAYKSWIRFLITRYKTSRAIFSWELCNEPRCPQCPTSTITTWATKTSEFIKSLDPTRLVSIGDEGWFAPSNPPLSGGDTSYAYSGYEGVDFVRNLQIKTIDYGTVHMYPEQWGYDYAWNNKWITQHNEIGRNLNKPVVVEEYGAPTPELRKRWLPEWQKTIVEKTSVAADFVWQFATQLSDGNAPYDQYAIQYSADPGSEFQQLGAAQARRMRGKQPVANL